MTTAPQAEARTGGTGSHRRSSLPPDAAALFDLLLDADEPIPQYEAGVAIGLEGSKDTVRRRVQHACKEIHARTGTLVCASWGQPAGIFLPSSREEKKEYIGRVLSRAYSTIGEFKDADREIREEIRDEVQRRLALEDGENGSERAVHESGHGICDQCGGEFDPYRLWQRFCSDDCRMEWHGRGKRDE